MKITIYIFLLNFALFSKCSADSCGKNCPGKNCPSCPCGNSARFESIQEWCAKYSEWDHECCKCIVQHESKGNSNAVGYNNDGSFDVGFWQINQMNWNACNGGKAPCGMKENLACAISVWKWGDRSFKFWSTAEVCGCSGKKKPVQRQRRKGGDDL